MNKEEELFIKTMFEEYPEIFRNAYSSSKVYEKIKNYRLKEAFKYYMESDISIVIKQKYTFIKLLDRIINELKGVPDFVQEEMEV